MPLHFSQASEKVRSLAAELSRRWKHHYLSTEHYFAAACRLDPAVSGALGRHGVTVEDLEAGILELVPEGDDRPLWEGMPESPRLRRILTRLAQQEAEACRAMRVEPVHLAAAVLGEGKGIPVRVLRLRGVDPERLRVTLRGEAPAPPAPGGAEEEKRGREKHLRKYTRDLVELARQRKIGPVIGRHEAVRRVLQILSRKAKSNPVLIGEAGVGKTAVAYGLAERIAAGRVPEACKGRRLLELQLAAILAGARHRGEFEERLQEVIREVERDPSIILFIDEIHQIVGAGDSRGAMDAGNILKPALARGDFPVLGATTTDEYHRYIESDPALERRFAPVLVEEPSEEETCEILRGLQPGYEAHHGVRFTDETLLAAVKLSVRYLPDRHLPDKAIDLIDEAAARVKTRSGVWASGETPEVTDEDVAEVVSDWTGIPVAHVSEEEEARLLDMENLLRKRVVGQDHVVESVARTIRMVRMGLASPHRPGGVFLFLGPTGVGKTELAKALAEFLFGSDREIVRLDMSEYQERHAVARLIGSPPGYVGHEEEGQLTRAVRNRPYCVLLLDEVEKAHPEIFDVFLQVFDDGRLTDSKGRTVNFTNTIIIMTSNLGTLGSPGIASPAESEEAGKGCVGQIESLPSRYREVLRAHFRPEFLNRIDEIAVFRTLSREELVEILRLQLARVTGMVAEQRGIHLQVEPEAEQFLLERGYQPQFGARPLQRAISAELSKPLAEEMLRARWLPGTRVRVERGNGRLEFHPLGRTTGEGAP